MLAASWKHKEMHWKDWTMIEERAGTRSTCLWLFQRDASMK